jgi:hypothetical protein
MSSTQLFILGPNSKIRTNVLRFDIMLPREMGHQNQVIVYGLSSASRMRHHVEGRGRIMIFTRVAQCSLPREYHGPAFLLYPNGVTRPIRLEFALQLGKRFPRGSQLSQRRTTLLLKRRERKKKGRGEDIKHM